MTRISTISHHRKPTGLYLKDMIYGAIDGTVTTFAIVAGVTGASLSPAVILILGFANLFADGFSMAVSNFLSIRAEREFITRARSREEWEVENVPEEETREIREIFIEKGFKGDTLGKAVEATTSNKKQWVDTMIAERLGLSDNGTDPRKHAFITLSAFVVVGFIPLVAYVLSYFIEYFRDHTFAISVILTSITFFAVGAAKTFFTRKNWFIEGLETLVVGGFAAFVAYYVGVFVKNLIG